VLLQLIHIRRVLTATATTAIYTLSLHDALPICGLPSEVRVTICSPSPGSPLGPWMLASLVHPMSHQPVDITGRDVEVEVSGLLIGEGAGHAGAGEPLRAAGPCRTLRTLCTFRASRSLRSLRTNLSLWAGGSLHALFPLR